MKDIVLDNAGRRALLAATLSSGLLIAQQVAGRATRDALFLSTFPVALLPLVMMASSAASVASAAALSRALARHSPFRVLPVAAGLSSALLVLEWMLSLAAPRLAAVAVYLHLALFGGTLVSGFWSLVNERFDPYTAKRVVGRIGLGASLGGIVGGVLALAASRLVPVPAMLLVMALLTALAMAGMARLGGGHRAPPALGGSPGSEAATAMETLRRVPYLRDLALVVAIGAIADSLLDYVLKAQAAAAFSRPAQLMSFFAIINTAFGFLSLALQAGLSGPSLRSLGLAGTVAVRPASVLVTALLGIFDPRLWVAIAARASHEVSTGSLFRSGYELLYTPLAESEKRLTKAVVDVGFDKLGSLLGGAVALLAVALAPSQTARVLFALIALLSLIAVAFTKRLHRGYVRTLEESLRAGRVRLDAAEVADEATRLTLARTGGLDRATLLGEVRALRARQEGVSPDPMLQAIGDLRSQDRVRIRFVLERLPEPVAAIAPHLLPLLAQDDMFLEVLGASRRIAPQVIGQLVDMLLDPRQDPVVRRRLPRVLKVCTTRRAVDGLLLGLDDERGDVREQCALALASITGRSPEHSLPRPLVLEAVWREVRAAPRALPLDHVFTLLSLAFEREPLQIALRAVRGSDRNLRGTALEYLDNLLPDGLFEALWPALGEPAPRPPSPRSPQDVRDELLKSSAALPVSRADLRARLPVRRPPRKG